MVRDFVFADAIEALEGALAFGVHPSLDGIGELTKALGNPQNSFSVVQVTGTNGKTSTARMVAALLRGEGQRTGLYTSPHLLRYPERIEVDGVSVADAEFAAAIHAVMGVAHELRPDASGTDEGYTEFEILTAAALWHFRQREVDFAVLEVGLGGRWDATSVAPPTVAVITGVGLDHTGILGSTREAIAAEKAAIIKPGSAPILGPGTIGVEGIFLAAAESCGTHARAVRETSHTSPVGDDLTVRFELSERPSTPCGMCAVDVRGIHGDYPELRFAGPAYQAPNIATAIAATEAALGRTLALDRARSALAGLIVPGRFQLLAQDPVLVADGAHNPEAAAVLASAIDDAWSLSPTRPWAILGILADKDAAGIVAALAPHVAGFLCTASASSRSRSASDLAELVRDISECPVVEQPCVSEAVNHARLQHLDAVATGSLTVAAEAIAASRR